MEGRKSGCHHECSGMLVEALGGWSWLRPHEVRSVALAISTGAMHAPSSCGKAKMWSVLRDKRN